MDNIHAYGEHVFIDHAKQPSHVLSHPRYVRQVLLEPSLFSKLGGDGKISGLSRVLGQGILTNSEPVSWRKHRRIIQPLLAKPRVYQEIAPILSIVDDWLEHLPKKFDLYPALLELSQRLMYLIIFGMALPDEALTIPLELATAKLSKQQRVRQAQQALLREHLEHVKNSDEDGKGAAGICPHLQQAGLEGETLEDELLTLMAAGHETSAAALAWTLALLCHHPTIMQRYQREINGITSQNLASLPYVRYVFAEALRLYPTIPLAPRVALHNIELDGVVLERGARVMLNIWGIHQHPEFWNNAEAFQPERFQHTPQRFSYLPFGVGERFCVGRALALLMGESVLPYILQKYTPRAHNASLPKRRLAISLQPRGRYWLELNPS